MLLEYDYDNISTIVYQDFPILLTVMNAFAISRNNPSSCFVELQSALYDW